MATRKIFTNQGAFGVDDDPTPGSVNAVSSGGVAKALSVGAGGEIIGEVVPPDTSAKNPLVNEKALRELMLNTIGGRTYKTTKIGNQIWLAENLDFKFYGLKIGTEEATPGDPYAAYYNNDEVTYGVKGNKYGLLYNGYAVKMLNKYKDQLIPGWHVPSAAEWDALATAVGGASVAGKKLKSKTGWSGPSRTDDFGFTAFPAGRGDGYGPSPSFSTLNIYAWFWTGDESGSDTALSRYISPGDSLNSDNVGKTGCFSVRLVRDA